MRELIIFFSGICITIIISLIVILYIKEHLKNILIDLCGTKARANFWMAFSNVSLVITPVIFASLLVPDGIGYDILIVRQLRLALIGLIGIVLIIGFVLKQYITFTGSEGKAGNE